MSAKVLILLSHEGRHVSILSLLGQISTKTDLPKPPSSANNAGGPVLLTQIRACCTLQRQRTFFSSKYLQDHNCPVTPYWTPNPDGKSGICDAKTAEQLALIINTDQGCQFTSRSWTDLLERSGVAISMDGKGRVFDNIFVERLWRTVKVENVYLHDYETPAEARLGLGRYFEFYNFDRPHQALGYRTPAEVYGDAGASPVALRAPCETPASKTVTNPPKKSTIMV